MLLKEMFLSRSGRSARVAAIAWQLSTVWDLSQHSRKLQQHYYNPASFPPRLQPVHFLQLLYLLP